MNEKRGRGRDTHPLTIEMRGPERPQNQIILIATTSQRTNQEYQLQDTSAILELLENHPETFNNNKSRGNFLEDFMQLIITT